jgi:DNA-binding beta-propeller fold protein YncE
LKKIVTIDGGGMSDCLAFTQQPEGVAVTAAGALYVTFRASGEIVRYPGCGQAATASRSTAAIGVEVRKSDGAVFVTTSSDRVLRLRPNLAEVLDRYLGGLFDPHTLTVLGKRLWVADTYNSRVVELRVR